MVLDLHTGFSVGRGGDLVFPSLKNFLQFVVIYTVKGFGLINKSEIDIFLNSLAFSMIHQMLAN